MVRWYHQQYNVCQDCKIGDKNKKNLIVLHAHYNPWWRKQIHPSGKVRYCKISYQYEKKKNTVDINNRNNDDDHVSCLEFCATITLPEVITLFGRFSQQWWLCFSAGISCYNNSTSG